MWWLLGVLAALAAAGSSNSRSSVVNGSSHSSENVSRTLTYRSRDGRAFFRFRFAWVGDTIRIYILEMPPRGSCHVLHDSTGPYICWAGRIDRLEGAKAVAGVWAEATLVYQRNGRSF